MSTGERLRRARLDAGKTLEQVAAETKIQPWILEALEREDFARVPGGVFIRGYLTAFARAVRLNPSEILTAYSEETAPPPAPPVPSPPIDLNERPATPPWQYVAIAAIVLAGAVMWRNMARSNSDVATVPASSPAANVTAAAPRAAPAPAPTRPTEPGATATAGAIPSNLPIDRDRGAAPATSSPSPTAATAPLVVQLHANNEVWVEATADGERKAYRLFEKGADFRLEARNEIRLLVGDAGALTYTINGKAAKSLGGPGIVRNVVISPRTMSSLTS